jgi:hypothetical protein
MSNVIFSSDLSQPNREEREAMAASIKRRHELADTEVVQQPGLVPETTMPYRDWLTHTGRDDSFRGDGQTFAGTADVYEAAMRAVDARTPEASSSDEAEDVIMPQHVRIGLVTLQTMLSKTSLQMLVGLKQTNFNDVTRSARDAIEVPMQEAINEAELIMAQAEAQAAASSYDPTTGTNTDDLSVAIREFEAALPGWWWSVGYCHLTRDASCGPDFRVLGVEHPHTIAFDAGFHNDNKGTLADALRHVLMQAQTAIRDRQS